MVWTVVCSGRSGDSGHPQGVQSLDACGTLDGTITLDACVNLIGRQRQESGRLDLLGSENRVITHAIGLQFVGWWAAVFLKPFEDVLLEIFKVHAHFLAASVIQPSCLPAAKLIKSMCRNYRVAQTRTESKRL